MGRIPVKPSQVYFHCWKIFLLVFMFTILYVPTLQEPLSFVLAAGTGTLFLVSLIVLRIYLVSSSSLCWSFHIWSRRTFWENSYKGYVLNDRYKNIRMVCCTLTAIKEFLWKSSLLQLFIFHLPIQGAYCLNSLLVMATARKQKHHPLDIWVGFTYWQIQQHCKFL